MLKKLYRIILSVFVAVLLTTAVSLSVGAESFLEPPTQQSQLEEPEEETESPREEYAQLLDEAEEPTGMNSVKMDKSVSNKTYSTDNIAGIVSWICVGVGLVVVAVMLISTKASGRRGV